ncbi:MAG: hypothetical protein ACE5NW_09380 [Acidiferrobacterales bacterium]
MSMTRERFGALWNRCLVDRAVAQPGPVYEELVQRYSEPHRHYHTCNHINHCLKQHDLATDFMDDPDAVEMGLWFHDAIYDPYASDNELRSAKLFANLVDDHVPPAFRRSVYDLILVTVHPEQPKRLDEQFMVDIDLSSFGLAWEAFKRDSNAVRAEKPHVSDEQFFRGQVKFLQSLLDRPTFFFTDFFRARYETTARSNITRYIEDLLVQGYG